MAPGAVRGNGAATMNERPGFGDVLCTAASDARLLVVGPGAAVRMPSLDGVALRPGKGQPCSKAALFAADCELRGGSRYADPLTGLTLLCVWPGRGALRYDGRQMA